MLKTPCGKFQNFWIFLKKIKKIKLFYEEQNYQEISQKCPQGHRIKSYNLNIIQII